MYKVKRFSEGGIYETLYSENEVNELIQSAYSEGYEEASRNFSDEESRKETAAKRKGESLQNSHRGLGRSLILGNAPGAIGAYITKGKVDEDYAEGYDEDEIKSRAGKRGAKYGATLGAGLTTLTNSGALIRGNSKTRAMALGGVAGMAGAGALGGYLGAKKNAKERLNKPRIKD